MQNFSDGQPFQVSARNQCLQSCNEYTILMLYEHPENCSEVTHILLVLSDELPQNSIFTHVYPNVSHLWLNYT
jgi:hypothetical protein